MWQASIWRNEILILHSPLFVCVAGTSDVDGAVCWVDGTQAEQAWEGGARWRCWVTPASSGWKLACQAAAPLAQTSGTSRPGPRGSRPGASDAAAPRFGAGVLSGPAVARGRSAAPGRRSPAAGPRPLPRTTAWVSGAELSLPCTWGAPRAPPASELSCPGWTPPFPALLAGLPQALLPHLRPSALPRDPRPPLASCCWRRSPRGRDRERDPPGPGPGMALPTGPRLGCCGPGGPDALGGPAQVRRPTRARGMTHTCADNPHGHVAWKSAADPQPHPHPQHQRMGAINTLFSLDVSWHLIKGEKYEIYETMFYAQSWTKIYISQHKADTVFIVL